MKQLKASKANILSLKAIVSLAVAVVVVLFLVVNSLNRSSNMSMPMSSPNMMASNTKVASTPAMKQAFVTLAATHTDVCQDMGNKPAINNYMNVLPNGSSLQGSCCSPMDMKKYVSQVTALKKYSDIHQIPPDPYDTSVASAKQMLGYYDNIQLTTAQQSVYDSAQKMTTDKGWCCCQCWAWYTHAGLAKYLITQQGFNTQQIVEVTNLEDCCGGAS